jgi:hypothetical protein
VVGGDVVDGDVDLGDLQTGQVLDPFGHGVADGLGDGWDAFPVLGDQLEVNGGAAGAYIGGVAGLAAVPARRLAGRVDIGDVGEDLVDAGHLAGGQTGDPAHDPAGDPGRAPGAGAQTEPGGGDQPADLAHDRGDQSGRGGHLLAGELPDGCPQPVKLGQERRAVGAGRLVVGALFAAAGGDLLDQLGDFGPAGEVLGAPGTG